VPPTPGEPQRPGICVGTDPAHTPEGLRVAAFDTFGDHPGGVAENTPFGGCYVPLKHLGRTLNVWSVMIEVRRDLYQQEPGGRLHGGYEEVTDRLSGFLSAIVHPRRIGPVSPR
jgi:N-formylglutamate deformylase